MKRSTWTLLKAACDTPKTAGMTTAARTERFTRQIVGVLGPDPRTQASPLGHLRRGGGCGRVRHGDPPARTARGGFLGGRDRAASLPKVTHLANCGRRDTAAASTRSQPATGRPPRIATVAFEVRTRDSASRRVHPDQETALAAGGHGQIPVEKEGQPSEHLLLAQTALAAQQLPDALGQMFVIGHAPRS